AMSAEHGAGLAVVKVGGSLYDLPDLGPRLWSWLWTPAAARVLLVPGGGAAADAGRDLDRRHGRGEAAAHGLALRALTLNAWFLASLLPLPVLNPLSSPFTERFSLLDAHAFAAEDALRSPGALPACWDATSDSVAARAAVVLGAGELVLLKSVTVPGGDWEGAARDGVTDPLLARVLRGRVP